MAIVLVLAIVCGVLASAFHHVVGMTPMLAGLLCASCFLRRRDVAIVGVGAVLVRDLLGGLHWFTLVRLVGIVSVIGILWLVRVRPSLKSLLTGLVVSLPVYHLVLAIGDWALQMCVKTPLTPQGLWMSIGSSLPYFQRAFLGELLLTSAFLSLYTLAGSLVAWRWPDLLPQPSKG
jgi:hypothetical protein